MQIIHHTLYNIKRRIPFPQIPGLIRAYLDKNGLKNSSFSYYFDEIVDSPDSFNEQMKTGSCARALKDCPLLGEIKFKSGEGRHFDTLFLSNDDSEGGCSEQDLSPLLNKIYRGYGFCETTLSFRYFFLSSSSQ